MRPAIALAALALSLTLATADAALPQADDASLRDPTFGAIDRKITDLDSEEAAEKRELAELGTQLRLLHARAVEGGRTYYKLTRAGLLPIGAGFDALLMHASRMERARKALGTLAEQERHTRSLAAAAAKKLDALAEQRRMFADQQGTGDAARFAAADEAEQRQAFEETFAGGTRQGFSAIEGSAITLESRGFAGERGKLTFPLDGRGEPKSVRRDTADGPGIEIRTAPGTAVRAVFQGHVAFADRYGPYGRLIILDHGEHYYTVYANLGSFGVKVGDEIETGGKLGTVGDEGSGALLYFEVRHRTETMKPEPWLGLD